MGRSELMFRRYLAEARKEVQRRGSTKITGAVYEGTVSATCHSNSLASGYARVSQDLLIRQGSRLLQGVVIRDTVILSAPFEREALTGIVLDGGIDVIATSGTCSMSFARAGDLHKAVRAGDVEAVKSIIATGIVVSLPCN